MLIYSIPFTQTASSGEFYFNTPKYDNVVLQHIYVEANTDTTTFDVQLIDDMSLYTYQTNTVATGKHNISLNIPLKGIYTFKVTNSSADEQFKGKIIVVEGTK